MSEARRTMLANAGIAAELHDHGVDERAVQRGLPDAPPASVAAALAAAKATAVSGREPDALVIGADQTLDLDGRTLGKPEGRDAARRQLAEMAGRTHALHSAFAIARGGRVLSRQTRSARLTMRPLGPPEIDRYLERAGGGVLRSVGVYQLEGLGIRLFEKIEGDYFTILGMPLLPLLKSLRRLQAIDL